MSVLSGLDLKSADKYNPEKGVYYLARYNSMHGSTDYYWKVMAYCSGKWRVVETDEAISIDCIYEIYHLP